MSSLSVDSKKLGEALEKFGSLQSALEHLLDEQQALEAQVASFKKQNRRLAAQRDKQQRQNEELNNCLYKQKQELQDLSTEIEQHHRQYGLFAGFMAMLLGSPSVTYSVDTLIALFQRLQTPGWHYPETPDELRSMFIRSVMGDYLKSYRCERCGAKFITNKKPEQPWRGIGGYCCPVCHLNYMVKEDVSFLELMVSDKKQLADVQHTEALLEESHKLKPFKALLEVPCEICNQPDECWDEYNVKLVIQGTGFGHTSCWNSEFGQRRQLTKAIQLLKRQTDSGPTE